MTSRRLAQIDALLERLLALPAERRFEELESLCGGDAELRRELETLLVEEAEATGLEHLDPLASPLALALGRDLAELEGDEVDDARGRIVGSFRIVSELGRGGMATVYLAERVGADFDQRVALKLLHPVVPGSQRLERFRQERRFLAGLEHPNISRLIDGGVSREGQPYLVMELVEGEPINRHCDDNALDIERRLRLWLEAARAVEHAHRCLLVHRDLKPSNILVTADGQVKLLDFGIAKLLEEGPGQGELTRTGLRPMTPRYASPEQVLGRAVTTATDVYQLGLLFYELLVGEAPYRLEGESRAELERAIVDQDPTRPSEVASRLGDEPARATDSAVSSATSQRSTTAAVLRKGLRGDLDAIALKALRKEPADRYGSVAEMREDVERYLEGLPVLARRGSAVYRAARFVRRNRAMVSVAAASLLLLLGVVSSLVFFYTERLRRERDQAQEVAAFLQELFQASDPQRGRGDEITARELLDRGAERIESELSGEPEVRARMMSLLGEIHRRLGLYDRAQSLLEEGLEIGVEAWGEEHPQIASTLTNLATLYWNQGRLAESERLYRRALEIRKRRLGTDHPEVAGSLNNLGILFVAQGRYAEAESLYRKAAEIYDEGEQPGAIKSLYNLANLYSRQGKFTEAEPLFRRALEAAEDQLGEEHPDVGLALLNLATMRLRQGQPAAARPSLERALEIFEARFGPEHPHVGQALQNLGIAYGQEKRYAEAEPFFERSHRIKVQNYGVDHPSVATSLGNLGNLYMEQGKYSQAEVALGRALAAKEKRLGAEHPGLDSIVETLGVLYSRTGDYERADELLVRAVRLREASFGLEHPATAAAWLATAELRVTQGRLVEARPFLERALALHEKRGGERELQVAEIVRRLAQLHTYLGDEAGAETLFGRALALLEESAADNATPGVATYRDYAVLRLLEGRLAEAESLVVRSLELEAEVAAAAEPTLAGRHLRATVLVVAGEVQRRLGRRGEAVRLCEEAIGISEALIEAAPSVLHLDVHARVLLCLDRKEEAAPIVDGVLATGCREPYFLRRAAEAGLVG